MTIKNASRRGFLRKTAMAGLAVAATAGAAKKVADLAIEHSAGGTDRDYLSEGDRILVARGYAEMSETEKNEAVRSFVENYKYDTI